MFLVVLGHCVFFLLPENENVYMGVFQTFRMPLFFFVSGFVFYKANSVWDVRSAKEFLCKKINVQIISPLLFFLIYVYLFNHSLREASFDVSKFGYWFTLALFEYFIIYILSCKLSYAFRLSSRAHDISLIMMSCFFLLLINQYTLSKFPPIFNLLGIPKLNFFIYFVFGTLVRKYFDRFEKALDSSSLVVFAIVIFANLNIFSEYFMIPGVNLLTTIIRGLAGIIIVFAFFRVHQDKFVREKGLGKVMQFVGRRTLDIICCTILFSLGELWVSHNS